MKKEYFSNLEYNRKKRKSAIFLSLFLTILILGLVSLFAINKDYVFVVVFAFMLVIPIVTLPSAFKNFPVNGKPIVIIEDDSITVNGVTKNVKEIASINVLIELPSCKVDKKDIELLNELKSSIPKDLYYGNFDLFYYDDKKKRQSLYSHVDHVVDALYLASKIGVKDYSLKFVINKNVVTNDCDLRKVLNSQGEKPLESVSKKNRTKQLI